MPDAVSMRNALLNAFTVDVEDYFQVSAFDGVLAREDWASQPLRVEDSTRRLMDLLDEFEVRATFFLLGWIAEQRPGLVREIAQRGHEIGAHGYDHRLVYDLQPDEFREDLRRTCALIEEACGRRPRVYRAPSFSFTRASLWALDVLAEEGFVLDSSIFPVRHDRYGIPGFARDPFVWPEPSRRGLIEFPMTTWRKLGMTLPTGGGGYFRLLPRLVHWGIEQANRRGVPAVFYVHPWELDPDQPRFRVGLRTRFRHYVGLRRTEARLRLLLKRHRFGTITAAAREYLGAAAGDAPATARSAAKEPIR